MSTLEKKIAFSFGGISLVFFVATIVTLIQVSKVTELSKRIQNIFSPSIQANLRMTNAINTSLTSLRSWMLIKDDVFIRQRQANWSIVEKMYKQLMNYSKNWNDTEQIEKLNNIGRDLALLEQYQQTIEKTIHTEQKVVAIQILEEKSYPLSLQIIANLRRISDPQNWEMERIFIEEEKQERILRNTAILFLFLCVASSVSLGVLITRAVIVPLNRTVELADLISKGNYSLSNKLLSGQEKLDVALRTMTKQLYEKNQENMLQQKNLEKYNQELTTLNSKLKISNEELSQFSYRTSHDLKAPLITVRGLAQVIIEDLKDEDYDEVEKNANKISKYVKKLEDLVVDILNLAKADLEITEKEKVNIEDTVFEIQEKLESIYINNDVKIETDIDNSVDFYLSKVRLTQVLENLISNAMKYSDKNKDLQFVRISTKQKEKCRLIVVEDNGIGIPEEFQNRVFSMFQRFHPNISYGSGLGMYIIKKHVEKMEGQINFVSSTSGTTIVIKFFEAS